MSSNIHIEPEDLPIFEKKSYNAHELTQKDNETDDIDPNFCKQEDNLLSGNLGPNSLLLEAQRPSFSNRLITSTHKIILPKVEDTSTWDLINGLILEGIFGGTALGITITYLFLPILWLGQQQDSDIYIKSFQSVTMYLYWINSWCNGFNSCLMLAVGRTLANKDYKTMSYFIRIHVINFGFVIIAIMLYVLVIMFASQFTAIFQNKDEEGYHRYAFLVMGPTICLYNFMDIFRMLFLGNRAFHSVLWIEIFVQVFSATGGLYLTFPFPVNLYRENIVNGDISQVGTFYMYMGFFGTQLACLVTMVFGISAYLFWFFYGCGFREYWSGLSKQNQLGGDNEEEFDDETQKINEKEFDQTNERQTGELIVQKSTFKSQKSEETANKSLKIRNNYIWTSCLFGVIYLLSTLYHEVDDLQVRVCFNEPQVAAMSPFRYFFYLFQGFGIGVASAISARLSVYLVNNNIKLVKKTIMIYIIMYFQIGCVISIIYYFIFMSISRYFYANPGKGIIFTDTKADNYLKQNMVFFLVIAPFLILSNALTVTCLVIEKHKALLLCQIVLNYAVHYVIVFLLILIGVDSAAIWWGSFVGILGSCVWQVCIIWKNDWEHSVEIATLSVK